MIYRCTFTEIDGVRYLAEYRLVSERGTPAADEELPAAPGPLMTEDGRYRFRLVDNPDCGRDGDERCYMLEDNPQPLSEVDAGAEARAAKRAAIQAALPDILLAVAEGKDAGEVTREVLKAAEAAREGACSKTS